MMLPRVLDLFRQSRGAPLTVDAVGRQLDLPPGLAAQLLHTLVGRGRLVVVDAACAECSACPLKPVCAGVPPVAQVAYRLPESEG